MRISKKHILVVAAFCAAGTASAQYVGPSGMRTTTVADVLKNARDDQQVMLQGVLQKKVGHEKYEFSDGTGTIRVEIDSKVFPREAIDEKTRIEILGEVEKDFMTSPEIDADAVRRIAAQ
jgi:uncharacterized protein (TIGR00156 family)